MEITGLVTLQELLKYKHVSKMGDLTVNARVSTKVIKMQKLRNYLSYLLEVT